MVIQPTVVVKSEAQLHAWRAELLATCRLPWAELDDRAATFTLSPDEYAVWDTIRSIDFLLQAYE